MANTPTRSASSADCMYSTIPRASMRALDLIVPNSIALVAFLICGWIFVVLISLWINYVVISHSSNIWMILFNFAFNCFAPGSYLVTALANPGVTPTSKAPDESQSYKYSLLL